MFTDWLYVFDRWRSGRQTRRTAARLARRTARLSDSAFVEYVNHVPSDDGFRAAKHINARLLHLPSGLCRHQEDALALRRLHGDLGSSFVAPCGCAKSQDGPLRTVPTRQTVAKQLPLTAWAEYMDASPDCEV